MERLKEKLDFLLDKYSVGEKVILKDGETALFGGKEIPLLPHRAERRYTELRNIVTGGTLEGVSMMKCEISTVRAAFNLAKNKNYGENIKAFNDADKIAELAKISARTGEREVL